MCRWLQRPARVVVSHTVVLPARSRTSTASMPHQVAPASFTQFDRSDPLLIGGKEHTSSSLLLCLYPRNTKYRKRIFHSAISQRPFLRSAQLTSCRQSSPVCFFFFGGGAYNLHCSRHCYPTGRSTLVVARTVSSLSNGVTFSLWLIAQSRAF